ncbi:MAG: hypothetical protein Kow0096_14910 [Thiohalomonadaceae bacterium]
MAIEAHTGNFSYLMDEYEADRLPADECVIWAGYSRNGRYGDLRWLGGKMVRVHRLAYELTKGEIPDGMVVCHKCDVPRCVNPHHLFVATQADNLEDSRQKGRARPRRTPKKPKRTVLTASQAKAARESPLSSAYFARRFNATIAAVEAVRRK